MIYTVKDVYNDDVKVLPFPEKPNSDDLYGALADARLLNPDIEPEEVGFTLGEEGNREVLEVEYRNELLYRIVSAPSYEFRFHLGSDEAGLGLGFSVVGRFTLDEAQAKAKQVLEALGEWKLRGLGDDISHGVLWVTTGDLRLEEVERQNEDGQWELIWEEGWGEMPGEIIVKQGEGG